MPVSSVKACWRRWIRWIRWKDKALRCRSVLGPKCLHTSCSTLTNAIFHSRYFSLTLIKSRMPVKCHQLLKSPTIKRYSTSTKNQHKIWQQTATCAGTRTQKIKHAQYTHDSRKLESRRSLDTNTAKDYVFWFNVCWINLFFRYEV